MLLLMPILTRLRSICQKTNRFVQDIDGVSLTDEDGQECSVEARFENNLVRNTPLMQVELDSLIFCNMDSNKNSVGRWM